MSDGRAAQSLARILSARAGLRLDGAGQAAGSILARAAERAGAPDVEHYAADVVVGNLPLMSLVEETRIGETYFFREPHQLEFLKRQLFNSHGPADVPLRLWSAGCASGEETYTLAMMALDAGVPAEILGTDISEIAIEAARRAEYPKWSLRGPQRDRALRHLQRAANDHFVVDERLRRGVTFGLHNLVGTAPPAPSSGGWNAILCRNVLIYFDQETQLRVIEMLAGALAENGWLFLGSCDPPASSTSLLLEAVVAEEGVFYRRRGAPGGKPPPAPHAPLPPVRPQPRRVVPRPLPPSVTGPPPMPMAAPEPLEDARAACLEGLQALELGDREAALRLFRRALYLDPALLVAELASAALFEREADPAAAARGYRRALRLASERPQDVEVPLASGATYGDISAHCHRMLVRLAHT